MVKWAAKNVLGTWNQILSIEAAKQGEKVGENGVSGFVFAVYFVGISGTPEGV